MATFKIYSPSDGALGEHTWRDFWIRAELADALVDAGASITYGEADVNLYLWGWVNRPIRAEQNNILWVVSHPDLLLQNIEVIKQGFRKIYCSSSRFCRRLKVEHQIDAEWLIAPAPSRPAIEYNPDHELSFVGNADPAKNRPALASVLRSHNSLVWGGGWKDLVGSSFMGDYIPFPDLSTVWNRSYIVPYSHHADMLREGFVADAALDVAANSGALLVSDDNPGFKDIFNPAKYPKWKDAGGLSRAVSYYLSHEPERAEKAAGMQRAAQMFTYEWAAQRLLAS